MNISVSYGTPIYVSTQLCEFFNMPIGDKISRSYVSIHIGKYIRQNKLLTGKDNHTIQPNKRLQDLLNIPNGGTVSMFDIRKYMDKHYTNICGTLDYETGELFVSNY